MSEDRKTWMIEPGDVLDVMTPKRKQPATVQVNKQYRSAPRPTPPASAIEPVKRRPTVAPPAKSKLHFATLVALTYLLGPLAIGLTPRGRRQKGMIGLAAASALATAILVLGKFAGLVEGGRVGSVWLWGALAAIAVIGGFTVWARALHLVGREGIPHLNKMPHWLRRGRTISGLGLLAPGSGLLLSGRSDRAAIVLWLLWPVALAAVILLNASGLWNHHLDSGWLASSGPQLEVIFMIAAGFLALGFLGHIAQALEGMRQVLVEPGLKTRVKGDYYALAVVASVVVMVVVANPVQMANQLDVGGDILREDGFQVIPLQLTLAASRLDPSKPEYSLQAMELYADLGQAEKSAALRTDLDQNLSQYVAMVQKEAVAEFGLAQAKSSTPVKPRAAEAWSGRQGSAEPQSAAVVGGMAAELFHGSLVQKDESAAAATDTVAVLRHQRVTRALGLPFDLGLPPSDADTSAGSNSAPGR